MKSFLPSLLIPSILAAVVSTSAATARADVVPAPLFCDHAVLQQGMPVPVWGTAEQGEAVNVSYLDQQRDTTADAQGHWTVRLAPLHAGQAGTLTIKGKNTVVLNDVVAGEVWLCAGQSNMQFAVSGAKDAAHEMAEANFPQIRQFLVPRTASTQPEPSTFLKGNWQPCTPQSVKDFTAVGYFFAREISREINVPVGIIDSSWGGTPIQPWIERAAFESEPSLLPAALAHKQQEMAEWPAKQARYDASVKQWEANTEKAKTEGKPLPPKPWHPGPPDSLQYMPTDLYNGMIHPLAPYAIRGALWYQGESNAETGLKGATEYAALQPRMVKGWRDVWGEGPFPFYFVQLPNYKSRPANDNTGESWAFFREAQAKSLSAQPNVAMAVTIDVGETSNIHPVDKQTVGHRLALIAEAQTYGKPVVWGAPIYRAMKTEAGGKVRVEFDHAEGGLTVRGETLKNFAIAGPDLKFVPAEAQIDGGGVLVSNPQVPAPIAVRYAWGNDPAGCNLYNKVGLPAAPFRTDSTAP